MTTSKKTRCFFSETELSREGQVIYLQPEETRHLQLILRLQPGCDVRVTDGRGHEAVAVIAGFESDQRSRLVLQKILQKSDPSGPIPRVLRLFTAYAAKGVMDEVVEKGQELGVTALFPLITERTVVSLTGEKEGKVLARWYKICRESAKQSGNAALMQVNKPVSIDSALKLIPLGEEVLLFHPYDAGQTLAQWLKGFRSEEQANAFLNIWIGPEGGFSDREVATIQTEGASLGLRITKVSLGYTILRVSTAVVAVLGAIKYS